jgi:non-specific protein-tyrosine kinase
MDLQAYIAPLRKWWWLIIIATLIAGGASYLAVRDQVLMYQARTTLMIGRAIENPNPTNTQLTLGQQLAPAYADIAGREPVRTATMEALGLNSLPQFSVAAIPNTQLLEIVVLDTSPQRAQAVANELANQLIKQSPSGLNDDELERQAFVNQQLDAIETQIAATEEEIEAKQAELGELFSAQQINDAQSQLTALQNKLTTLQGNYAALLASTGQEGVNALTVIEAAHLPQQPIDPNIFMTVLTAAAIGMAISVAAAYILEYLDDRIKTPHYIKNTYNIPTLGAIAPIGKKGDSDEDRLITVTNPRSPIAEAFRGIRTRLFHANAISDEKSNTILVTSSSQGEGKSIIAANLAIVLAQGGNSVLLIDADLHRPKQAKIFELPGEQEKGLSNLLAPLNHRVSNGKVFGPLSVDKNVHILKLTKTRLTVLPSGTLPPNPGELLASSQMRELLTSSAVKYDYVIIDSPPILAVHDGVMLSTMVDSVLLVVDMNRTRRNDLKHTIERLREVKAPIVGVILNRISRNTEGYSYNHLQQRYLEPEQEKEKDAAPAMPGDLTDREIAQPAPRLLGSLSIGQLSSRLGGSGKNLEPREEV